ncbi:hypothetical protein BDZ89DRAFT_563715 [Hymenopellis radicata]|nr:hypothetical protein BDZ89DRAFT_563715 [Hymenopellis radicata]
MHKPHQRGRHIHHSHLTPTLILPPTSPRTEPARAGLPNKSRRLKYGGLSRGRNPTITISICENTAPLSTLLDRPRAGDTSAVGAEHQGRQTTTQWRRVGFRRGDHAELAPSSRRSARYHQWRHWINCSIFSARASTALVSSLAKLYKLPCTPSQLSLFARQGSGSACYVAWEMGHGGHLETVHVTREIECIWETPNSFPTSIPAQHSYPPT